MARSEDPTGWREKLREIDEEFMLLEPDIFDTAIVGYTAHQPGRVSVVVYSRKGCIDALMSDGADYETASESVDFNTIGSWMGERTPVFLETDPEA